MRKSGGRRSGAARVGRGWQGGCPCPSVDWVGGKGFFFCESRGRGSGWQFARNCLKPNIQSRKRLARSPGKPRKAPLKVFSLVYLFCSVASAKPTVKAHRLIHFTCFCFWKPTKSSNKHPLRRGGSQANNGGNHASVVRLAAHRHGR
jgi:hypothetical protein